MNRLQQLRTYGQSFWLDYMRRGLITSGELDRLITLDGLAGMTSNPTIFEQAIDHSQDYDASLQALVATDPDLPPVALFEALALEDIRRAADAFRPLYEATHGIDGFVSFEVAPSLAHDTERTIAEAQRLFAGIGRPNVMIKVPATPEGMPAIEALTAAGVNGNITLSFSLSQYEGVAAAFVRGMARARRPEAVTSVASVFVSRIDTVVDRELEANGTPEALALRGRVAIANAKAVYGRFREIFHGEAFAAARARNLRVQRPLWGSTGTKNKAYSDVKYVEELIGPDTINTMPPATADAFRDHGRARASLPEGLDEAREVLSRLSALGVDLDAVTRDLLADGVAAFAKSYDALITALTRKIAAIAAQTPERQHFDLGGHSEAVASCLREWQRVRFGQRLWAKDPTLWSAKPVDELANRLGWLELHTASDAELDAVVRFGEEVAAEGVEQVVLLGMGGSSLAPEVFQATFGNAAGRPPLVVLDTTHPAAVAAIGRRVRPDRTLFLVSSKSGTTLESLSLFRYFWAEASRTTGTPGHQFAAITDPGTPLERLAKDRGFRRVFQGPPEVGGRYAALSVFGMVPAALIGVDVHRLRRRAADLAEAASDAVSEPDNPALALGAALGELGVSDIDKVTFFTSPRLAAFPAWLEQLIAESTGKNGKGLVPIADEPEGQVASYGRDRFFVSLALEHDAGPVLGPMDGLRRAGFPSVRIRLTDAYDVGHEILRWEIAVAAAGAVLGIQPFDQPDVQLAKDLARKAMAGAAAGGRAAAQDGGTIGAGDGDRLRTALQQMLKTARPGDYCCVQAYLAPDAGTMAALQTLRREARDRLKLATTAGYGPRFLHSTGQLHKGGPDSGIFLQLVDEPPADVAVPETDFTFGALIRAQALGDYAALAQRGRRVLRINVGSDVAAGLAQVVEAWSGR